MNVSGNNPYESLTSHLNLSETNGNDDENLWGLRELFGDDSEVEKVAPDEINQGEIDQSALPEKTASIWGKCDFTPFKNVFFEAPLVGIFQSCFVSVLRRLLRQDLSLQFNPHTYVIGAMISAAVRETASGVHALALHCLGDRDTYENLNAPANATVVSRLRQKTWKVISFCEEVPHKIDVVYSRCFDVRTEKEILSQFPNDQAYYRNGDPKDMEIVRRAICEMVYELFRTVIPHSLGVVGAGLLGFPNPMVMLYLKFIPLQLFTTVAASITTAYSEIKVQENERADIVRNFNYLSGLELLEKKKDSYLPSEENYEAETPREVSEFPADFALASIGGFDLSAD